MATSQSPTPTKLTIAILLRCHAGVGAEITGECGWGGEAERCSNLAYCGIGAFQLRLGVHNNHIHYYFLRRHARGLAYYIAEM